MVRSQIWVQLWPEGIFRTRLLPPFFYLASVILWLKNVYLLDYYIKRVRRVRIWCVCVLCCGPVKCFVLLVQKSFGLVVEFFRCVEVRAIVDSFVAPLFCGRRWGWRMQNLIHFVSKDSYTLLNEQRLDDENLPCRKFVNKHVRLAEREMDFPKCHLDPWQLVPW